jgi:uncharacterized OB-fold protein
MVSVPQPLPVITPESAPFWDGCRNGHLLLQRCTECAVWRYPPTPVCPGCGRSQFAWLPVSGRGRIYSFVIYHRPFHPAYTTEVPYAVALVELDEGVRMLLRVVDFPLEALTIALAGEIRFHRLTEEVSLPVFVPTFA